MLVSWSGLKMSKCYLVVCQKFSTPLRLPVELDQSLFALSVHQGVGVDTEALQGAPVSWDAIVIQQPGQLQLQSVFSS